MARTPALPHLRQAILRFVAAEGPGSIEPAIEQVLLTAGSNQLLHLVAETLLDPGDIVLCSAPSYFVFMGILGSSRRLARRRGERRAGADSRGTGRGTARGRRSGELIACQSDLRDQLLRQSDQRSLSRRAARRMVEIAQRWSA